MILDWNDILTTKQAVENFRHGGLEGETNNMRRLMERYFSFHSDEGLPYMEKFSQLAPGYVERSLKALGLDSWDALKRQLNTMAAFVGATDSSDRAAELRDLIAEAKNCTNRAGMLVTVVWPTLIEKLKQDRDLAERCGHTLESFSKLSAPAKAAHIAAVRQAERL
jgi:hypothetical protein